MSNIIRIGNGQGFWGDSIDAPVRLAKDGPLDYLTLDYLAEVTLSIMQRQKLKNPNTGYARDFLDLVERILPEISDKGVKVITNAGGVNPQSCRSELIQLAKNSGKEIKIGVIQGDDIFPTLTELRKKGVSFENMDTGADFDSIIDKVYSANVYINSSTISEALDKGAQIVLAGRVSDPGLALGPCIYEFGWKDQDYDLLAAGTLAGHIAECGAQCTGGNYSRWQDVPKLADVGYPIIEMQPSGKFCITKHENSGGLISRETIGEQVLYEMGDPSHYISPDVCVDFTSFNINDLGGNKVSISNVAGLPPTDSYKVSISYFAGYKASGQLTVSGPNAYEKAQLTAKIIWKRLKNAGVTFEDTSTEYLGLSSCHGEINAIPSQINEVVLRLGVKDSDKNKVNRFGKELAPVITSGPPGITGFSGGRPKAQEIIAYWPALIPKTLVHTSVDVV
ncbi:MAG: DUF1446 domain-containing protein [Candidatus Marinimicrobia bacterium]|jgi:hypothetical protein|nr:DUF1446 domain-containing protein [Candidatus Neomarinimicrobiota bacterium]